jgi:hypothetical protein
VLLEGRFSAVVARISNAEAPHSIFEDV